MPKSPLGTTATSAPRVGNQPSNIIARLKMATPTADEPIKRSDDGLFRTVSGDPLPNDENARLQVGALESSNVNSIEAMVGMIQHRSPV